MKSLVILLFVYLLAGCGQLATQDSSTQAASQTPAVDSLYQAGLQHKRSGELAPAQASFERALRIDPNNAVLWFELAQIAFAQRDFAESRELALRASTFAGDNDSLQRDIQRLLKKIDKNAA